MWALSITISGSVLCAGLVSRVLGHAAIRVHSREVDSSVQSTSQVGHIDVEGKLLVLQGDHLVVGVIGHEVDSAPDVLAGYKFEGKGVTSTIDTVNSGVIRSFHGAVGGTCCGIRAESLIPKVIGVAVGVATWCVKPAPVRVEDDLGLLGGAAAGGTLLGGQGRVSFGLPDSNQLAADTSEDRETEDEFAVHRGEYTGGLR